MVLAALTMTTFILICLFLKLIKYKLYYALKYLKFIQYRLWVNYLTV